MATQLHERFTAWGLWVRTRPHLAPGGRLRSAAAIPLGVRGGHSEGPNLFLDADASELNLKVACACEDDRLLVHVEFVYRPHRTPRVTAVALARQLGVSRASYYRMVTAACQRIVTGPDGV